MIAARGGQPPVNLQHCIRSNKRKRPFMLLTPGIRKLVEHDKRIPYPMYELAHFWSRTLRTLEASFSLR